MTGRDTPDAQGSRRSTDVDSESLSEELTAKARQIRGIQLLLWAYAKRDSNDHCSQHFDRQSIEKVSTGCLKLRTMVLDVLPHLTDRKSVV